MRLIHFARWLAVVALWALGVGFGPMNRQKTARPRWTVSGAGLSDLTITPSVDVGDVTCWHGWITNGLITNAEVR